MSELFGIITRLLDMAQDKPWVWVIIILIAAPIILWWWNALRRQWAQSGIKEWASKLMKHREATLTVTPSPRSGAPFILWKELLIWLIVLSPLFIIIIVATNKKPFSTEWWVVISSSIMGILVFSSPIFIMTLAEWFQINKNIKTALLELKQISDSDSARNIYLDTFIAIEDDIRMGLDPRMLPIIYQPLDIPFFLNKLVSLRLIKPDKKTKPDMLARRYYLTRNGATLIERIKQNGR
ncbi:MAG: hypothetical protein V1767_08820 [Chloroflexota bacterium]